MYILESIYDSKFKLALIERSIFIAYERLSTWMIDLRIFVELDGLPLILVQALHSNNTVTEEWVNSYEEAYEWLKSVLGPNDLLAIHTRPFQRI